MQHLSTSLRECSASETFARIAPHFETLGITRITDITGLDTVGVPVYQVVRPDTSYPITVFAGKGCDAMESKVSACMEAVESYVAERYAPPERCGVYHELMQDGVAVIDPETLILPRGITVDNTTFHWVAVSRLHASNCDASPGSYFFVPKEAVMMPCPGRLWPSHTNGIASGNTITEALIHAIFEIVERDAQSIALVSKRARRVSRQYLENPQTKRLVRAVQSAGLECYIKDVTSDVSIPSYGTIIRDPNVNSPWFCSGGAGTHVDPCIAVQRSITEAIQSRTCMIAGAREDLRDDKRKGAISFDKLNTLFEYWLSDAADTAIEYAPPVYSNLTALLDGLIVQLECLGFTIYWTDMSIRGIPSKVVRVLIPELECFVLDKSRIGERLSSIAPQILRVSMDEQTRRSHGR